MSQNAVADAVVVDDVVDVQFDVEDVVDEHFYEEVHDVDLDDFPHVPVGWMYLTLIATHTGVGIDDQDNEAARVDVLQHLEDEVDVIEYPEDELLTIDIVEDGIWMVDIAECSVDAKDLHIDIPMQEWEVKTCGDLAVVVECLLQSDVELGLVRVEGKHVQVEGEDADKRVKDILDALAIVDVDEEV